ncbi:von Willebrand factor type A domain containing protein [Acanthamoeba castellanii str. Neff]|uniref:von Willebrand factor type A domain containing protein n=1 Tax=Acanthamoeba castellanii (strain ATCC 30010 / Neff) TaxID=1257118 RepID=L8GHR5_ACACF|nr:von Willebrand factor type A domain containing protein [Acanthamoeba castellanii str. Neff]ELR12404.1 von Willebrand factor type A domain containing protein [Acanthamoeba castellanii str. Neff]
MARTQSLIGFTVLFALVAVLLLAPSAANAQQQACPQSDVRPDAWVQALVQAMNDLGLSSEKMALLQKSVANDTRVFSGAQIVNILKALPFTDDKVTVLNVISFSSDRITVLKGIKDTLLNASDENKVFIATTCWSMSSDQQAAYAILRDVASRDCIFGSVTALSATFVIDVSGSMDTRFTLNGTTYSRLSYVQQHLSQVISEQLKPYQQFNVIIYSSGARALFSAPVNATTANIKSALTFVAGLRAGGSTNTYAGLQLAFSSSKDTVAVYLLTDGVPDSGLAPRILQAIPQWEAQRAADRQIRIFATAFLLGPDSAADKQLSAAFMKQVAAITNGVYRNMDQTQ